MATCYSMVPGTWPPLGVPESVLQLFEPTAQTAPPQLDSPQTSPQDVGMGKPPDSEAASASGFLSLSVTQLRSESARLKRLLADRCCTKQAFLLYNCRLS